MNIQERIRRSIAKRKDDVFVRSDFASFGSEAQVSRALRDLLARDLLIRLGVGVYAKTKKSVLSGKAIPVRPVEVLAPIALKKLGVTLYPSRLSGAYNSGATTQIPAGNMLNTGSRRIKRKISFGNQVVAYEKNRPPTTRTR
jgi:hypothetical protein